MEKRVFLAMILAAAASASPAPCETRKPLNVCPSCEFRALRDAISHAAAGDTILVHGGIYAEGELIVGKPMTIAGAPGEAAPLVDGLGRRNVFLVTAPNVSIRGIAIRNSGQSYTEEFAGIKVDGSAGCHIENNELEKNTFGIYLSEVRECVIKGNRIHGEITREAAGGNGIHLWNSDRIVIEDNTVSGHRDGIYFEFVRDSAIRRNISRQNLRYGLHFMYSNHDDYEGNSFQENGSGVAVMYSKEIRIAGNLFEGSLGGAAYGILLKDIAASELRGNRFLGNTVGAYVEGTTRSLFVSNVFSGNGWALRVLGNTDGNNFIANDFLANTFDLSTNATQNLNRFSGNFWSRYRGIDLDRNGVGDSPYYPVQLSSILMEKYPASVLLTRSFFFTVLDEAENLLPILTPESFQDPAPQMKRNTQL